MKSNLIFIIILAILFLATPTYALTFTVCSSSCDYATIQGAINGVAQGDTIQVKNGTYTEQIIVNKTVILEGESNAGTQVIGGFKVESGTSMIKNFNITGGYSWDPDGGGLGGVYKTGIYATSDNNVFENNKISNIQAGTGGVGGNYVSGGSGGTASAIYLSSSTLNNITSNILSSLTGGTGGTGGQSGSGGTGGTASAIYLSSSTLNNITLNTISSLAGGSGGTGGQSGSGGTGGTASAIYLSSSTLNNITSNTISSLSGGTGGVGGQFGSVGASGTASAVWLDISSYNNDITSLTSQGAYSVPDQSKINTIEGTPILYFYNKTDLNISGFNVTTSTILIGGSIQTGGQYGSGGSGGISTGITLINVNSSLVEGNIISGFGGMSGGVGGNYGSGGSGGTASAIYLSSSTLNSITSNTISSLTGGTGGPGGYFGSGGTGGTASAIYLSSSTLNSITSNTISSLTGGTGGVGGPYGSGGTGGTASAIYLSSSTLNNITSNTISSLTGGQGGTGGWLGSGGSGGITSAIYLSSSTLNNITSNTISSLSGGTGGVGGEFGSGGSGGTASAVWLDTESYNNDITSLTSQGAYSVPDQSKINTIEGTPILYFYNKTDLNISGFNVTTSTILIGGTGGSGGYQGSGGTGGISTGITLINVNSSLVEGNIISGFGGMSGGTGGQDGSGGTGGITSAIYLSSSTLNSITSNTISSLTGGQGGTGGTSSSGGSGGTASAIYLSSSTLNNLTLNTLSSLTGGTGGTGGYSGSGGGTGGKGTGYYFTASDSNKITDSNITNSADDYDVYSASDSDNILINATYDLSRHFFSDALSSLEFQWYLNVSVVDENTNSIFFANIEVKNNNSIIDYYGLTNIFGTIGSQSFTEFIQDTNGVQYSGFNNYTITGNKSGISDIKQFNLTGNSALTLILTGVPADYPENVTFSINGTDAYSMTGAYSSSPTIDYLTELNTYMQNCQEDAQGYCYVPLEFSFDGAGKLNVANLFLSSTNFHAMLSNEGLEDTIVKNFWTTSTTGDVCLLNSNNIDLDVGDFVDASNTSCDITCDTFLSVRAITTCGSSDEYTLTPTGC